MISLECFNFYHILSRIRIAELLSCCRVNIDSPSRPTQTKNATLSKSNITSMKPKEGVNATRTTQIAGNLTRGEPLRQRPSPNKKKGAFRPVRKFFASTTGLHGFFSKKKKVPPPRRRLPTRRPPNVTLASNATALRNATKSQQIPPGSVAPQLPHQAGSPLQSSPQLPGVIPPPPQR